MEFKKVATERRSVHDYADQEVDRDTIEEIVDQARFAPSRCNLQPWEFVVHTDSEDKERLAHIADDQDYIADAPAVIVLLGCTDPELRANSVYEDLRKKGYATGEEDQAEFDVGIDELAAMSSVEQRLWVNRSTALIAMQFMLAAENEGLATCPTGFFDEELLTKQFPIPDTYEPVLLLPIGHPDENSEDLTLERRYRRSVDDIIHYGRYDLPQ